MRGLKKNIMDIMDNIYPQSLDTQSLRLLILQPGHNNHILRGSLQILPIEFVTGRLEPYEALSYTWGSEKNPEELRIDNQSLFITADLAAALRRFRSQHSKRTLWIDQICINQKDGDERNAQVSIMRLVYESAERVIVWLGEELGESASALRFAEELNHTLSKFEHSVPDSMVMPADFGRPLRPTGYTLPPIDSSKWAELRDIFQRRWFGRLWIVQEVLLTAKLYFQCGGLSFPWELLEELTAHIKRHEVLGVIFSIGHGANGFRLMDKLDILRRLRRSIPSEEVITTVAEQDAQDPRDFIYGILSLINQSESQHVIIDYRRTTAEVYTDFTRTVIERFNRKTILNHVELDTKSTTCAPSWVPDWRSKPLIGRGKPWGMARGSFSASVFSPEMWSFSEDGKKFKVRGRQVDALSSGGVRAPLMDLDGYHEDILGTEGKFVPELVNFFKDAAEIARSCTAYSQGQRPDMILCLTCARETKRDDTNVSKADDFLSIFKEYVRLLEEQLKTGKDLGWMGKESWLQRSWRFSASKANAIKLAAKSNALTRSQESVIPTAAKLFDQCFSRELRGNYIAKTGNGRLASVPQQRQEGDIVVILYGRDTPFLLRRVSTGNLLVGECYVHGIMHGEAMKPGIGIETDFLLV